MSAPSQQFASWSALLLPLAVVAASVFSTLPSGQDTSARLVCPEHMAAAKHEGQPTSRSMRGKVGAPQTCNQWRIVGKAPRTLTAVALCV